MDAWAAVGPPELGRRMQLVWTGERSTMAGHLGGDAKDLMTDRTAGIFADE